MRRGRFECRSRAGELTLYREVKGNEGFGATNPCRQHFGLGSTASVERVTIEWPSGATQVLRDVKANQVITVEEAPAPGAW
ncbi:MAG: ASPIC/UnbV domain-containing protein [Bryobacterales bacterium]|nr:ASPIC/UnbV domain-containing protein [Bryobacterales bacterium]